MFEQQEENWKADALRLAQRDGVSYGKFKDIHMEIQRMYPNKEITYDKLRQFLWKNGFRTHVRRKRNAKTTKVKNFSVLTEGKYALVKMDRNGIMIGKPMNIDREEALKIIERKVF